MGEDGVDHDLVEKLGLFKQGSVAGGVEGDEVLGGGVEEVEPRGGWAEASGGFVASFHQVDRDGDMGRVRSEVDVLQLGVDDGEDVEEPSERA
ncbi:hypothetical protein [Lapillicoccus sp.]|uniref:hypothetical protein n=1 Tax=Lapillicoccus sp. TaxID=1909287 RepID=UPI0025CB7E65|nr:hypothetical protein [Lapillicoccus sp.]